MGNSPVRQSRKRVIHHGAIPFMCLHGDLHRAATVGIHVIDGAADLDVKYDDLARKRLPQNWVVQRSWAFTSSMASLAPTTNLMALPVNVFTKICIV